MFTWGRVSRRYPYKKKNLISAPTSHHICNKFNSRCLTDRYGRRNCTFSKESKVAHLRDLIEGKDFLHHAQPPLSA